MTRGQYILSHEQLDRMGHEIIKKVPYKVIAEEFGVSAGYVRQFAHKYGISQNKANEKWSKEDEQILLDHHEWHQPNLKEIQKMLSTKRTIYAIREKFQDLNGKRRKRY